MSVIMSVCSRPLVTVRSIVDEAPPTAVNTKDVLGSSRVSRSSFIQLVVHLLIFARAFLTLAAFAVANARKNAQVFARRVRWWWWRH